MNDSYPKGPQLTATDNAKAFLAAVLGQLALDVVDCRCLRLRRERARLAIVAGTPLESDAVITHDGDPVLVVDPDLARAIGDRTLDVHDSGRLGLI